MELLEYYTTKINVASIVNSIEATEKKNIKPNGNLLYDIGQIDQDLKTWMQDCIDDVVRRKYNSNIQLKITECWATKTTKFQNHSPHVHPNSILSGIFYLTDHKESRTIFYEKNPWDWCNSVFSSLVKDKEIKTEISPKIGKLLIFPSNLKHSTAFHLYETPRYTISFNTFFSCDFGGFTHRLNLQSEDYK